MLLEAYSAIQDALKSDSYVSVRVLMTKAQMSIGEVQAGFGAMRGVYGHEEKLQTAFLYDAQAGPSISMIEARANKIKIWREE